MRVRSAALLLGLSLSAGPAAAAVISYTLKDHIAGVSLGGPAPWVTVTIAGTRIVHLFERELHAAARWWSLSIPTSRARRWITGSFAATAALRRINRFSSPW